MATENRYIRIEDWQGNTYLPLADASGNSTAGKISDITVASTDPADEATGTYTEGEIIVDPDANGGKCIYIVSDATQDKIIYSTCFSDLSFGAVAVSLRLKSSIGSSTTPLIKLNLYSVDNSGTTPVFTEIDSTTIDGSAIGIVNQYVTLGKVIDYKGHATGSNLFKVQVVILKGTGCQIWFDQLAVAMSLPTSGTGIDVQNIDNHLTLVIPK